jgi:XTP/dITP diphosphohydrolase
MKLVLASRNPHKLRELQTILSGLGLEVIMEEELGLNVEVEETGATFEENSLLKAQAVLAASGLPTVADDSGLMVDALGGAPGVYSARYGAKSSDAERVDYLLGQMRGVPDGVRGAKFVCVITCLWPDGRKIVARGECCGEILRQTRGQGGFGYDPVFYLPPYGMTYAELPNEQKNAISHRGNALREFCRIYKEEFLHDK